MGDPIDISRKIKMKNKAAAFLKQIINKLTMELKRRTRAFKTRLVIFSLLHNSSFTDELKGLMGHVAHHLKSQGEEQMKDAITSSRRNPIYTKYAMGEDEEAEKHWGSVTEMVKHSKEDKGEEFRLEEEIDRVADLFIRRFHRQMWLQKQLSFESPHQDRDNDHTPTPPDYSA